MRRPDACGARASDVRIDESLTGARYPSYCSTPPAFCSAPTVLAEFTLDVDTIMKRFLLVLPFLLGACDRGASPTEVAAPAARGMAAKGGSCTLANGNTATPGFDQYGYNRCAHQFVGTFAGYCAARGQGPTCGGVVGSTKLVMKWNEEWDRYNADHYGTNGPYDAWLDNEMHGAYLDGTPFSEHFKTRWDAVCVATGGVASANGGTCIWNSFEVLMDQGTENGEHIWWTKLTPAGYGN